MRVGSLVYATDQGLGILAKSFYDHGVITDPVVVSYTARGTRPMHLEWYPDAPVLSNNSIGGCQELNNWLDTIDVFLAFETPFAWQLFDACKKRGIKTVLMPMHECLHEIQFIQHPPDLLLCPSALEMRIEHPNKVFLPVPVEVPWRQRTRAEVFVHNAGHGGLKGRNGTQELIEALRYVKSDAKFIIRSQAPLRVIPDVTGRVTIMEGTFAHGIIWEQGDVFVFPEKFNGLSLPLQEARAAGMLVMGTDRFPMNTWLPREPLIMVSDYKRGQRTFPQFCQFNEAVIDPRDIAAKIDEWYGRDITEYSLQGKAWAETMSWERLKPRYIETLENLVGS